MLIQEMLKEIHSVMRGVTLLSLAAVFLVGWPGREALSQGRLKYLSEPMVTWDRDWLSGELDNAPVDGLLQELLKGRDSDCKVTGRLQGSVSIRFSQLTSEEIIRRIMNNKNFNYTLVVHGPDSDSYGIKVLTVYQGDTVVRFETTPAGARKQVSPPPRNPSIQTVSGADPDPAVVVENLKRLDGEIKMFMDDMLASGKISREDYEKAISTLAGP